MRIFFIALLFSFFATAQSKDYRVDLNIDPDFPDIRIASVSVQAPVGFLLESFTSQVTGEIEIRPSHSPKLFLKVEKGKTYNIQSDIRAELGFVILNFAILKSEDIQEPGDYHIGNFTGTKNKWHEVQMADVLQKKKLSFPNDWIGVYKGEVVRHTTTGIIGQQGMELHIQKTADPNRFIWKIAYEGQPTRNYELIIVDKNRGIYVIDEKNSIMLYSFYANDTLFSHFGAHFGYLLATYELKNNQIHFRTTVSNARPYQTTGGQGSIPMVHSFQVREQQVAVLTKIK